MGSVHGRLALGKLAHPDEECWMGDKLPNMGALLGKISGKEEQKTVQLEFKLVPKKED